MGDPGSVRGSARSSGEGNGYPLQYSCLENSMDRGASGRGSAEAVLGPSMFSSSETGVSGKFGGRIKGANYRFTLQDGTWECSPGRSLCLTKSSACGSSLGPSQ